MTPRRRGIPLRVSLVAMMMLMLIVGLLLSGLLVTSVLRTSLVNRTDDGLRDAVGGWARKEMAPAPMLGRPGPRRPPSEYFVAVIDSDGSTRTLADDPGAPDLRHVDSFSGTPRTVKGADGSDGSYRVVAAIGPRGEKVIVAASLNDVNSTVERLIWLQTGLGLVVVVVVGGLAYALVRTSLRPLSRVEETAHQIAEGNLELRVPQGAENTEVGRLSASLNTMLRQIHTAFDATAELGEQARQSEEKMRQFVADASHELRTPLTSIRGFSELYRQGAMSDPDAVMDRIESEAARMGLLVEDLLMLARLDAQRPLENHPVDLLALASECVHAAKAAAPHRDIDIKILAGPGVPEVMGDSARLSQVVSNLLGNAVRHTPEDARITVEVGTDGDDAIVRVVDTGPGIAPEDHAKVFERFHRIDSSRNRGGGGGSGLGLSIVAALVAAHGGTVGVDSEPGHGAQFWVRLPRSQ